MIVSQLVPQHPNKAMIDAVAEAAAASFGRTENGALSAAALTALGFFLPAWEAALTTAVETRHEWWPRDPKEKSPNMSAE